MDQNYFEHSQVCHRPTERVSTGASALLSELFFQRLEHDEIFDIKNCTLFQIKLKVVPLHAIDGAWGGGRCSSYPFLPSALRKRWAVSLTPRPRFALGKGPPVPTVQEAGWAPEPVWTQRLEEWVSAFVGDRVPALQFEVRHDTDWATWFILELGTVNIYRLKNDNSKTLLNAGHSSSSIDDTLRVLSIQQKRPYLITVENVTSVRRGNRSFT